MQYIKNFKKFRPLLGELVKRDIKVKYRRSILGMLWTVLNPLLMMCVLTIVFSHVFRFDIDNFPVYLLCGNILFSFFNEATTVAMSSILNNGSLIKKVYVPKYLFPVSKVLSSFINLLSSLVALIIVVIFTGTRIQISIVFSILPIFYVFVFSLGIGLMLSAFVVYFRDILHLYGVVLTVLMYLTPIFYPVSMLPDNVYVLVNANPLTHFVQMLRECVLFGNIPTVAENIYCVAISFAVLFVGILAFWKCQDKFVLKI